MEGAHIFFQSLTFVGNFFYAETGTCVYYFYLFQLFRLPRPKAGEIKERERFLYHSGQQKGIIKGFIMLFCESHISTNYPS